MKLLLDTHVWLWAALDPQRLGRRVRARLENPANELWVSPISAYEIVSLCRRGKLKPNVSGSAWVAASIQQRGLRVAPVTLEVALAADALGLPHGDPMDRIIAATATVYGLTLVTADRDLQACKQVSILPYDA